MALQFKSLDMILTSEPAVCSWGPGRLDLFARGEDQALWHRSFEGSWSSWEQLGPNPIASSPAAVSWARGRIDVFVRGKDDALYYKRFDGRWSGYEQLQADRFLGAPTACSWGAGRLDVFVRGTDNALHQKTFDGSWHGYESRGGVLTSDPAAVSWGVGRIDVVVRNLQNALSHLVFEGQWRAWENLPGNLDGRPTICSAGAGALDIFCRDATGRAVQMSFPGSWAKWQDIGADAPSALACHRSPDGRVDLFAQGKGGHLVHAWWDPASGWQPHQPPRAIAFALSGGGARGDFQVGALRCLHDRGIRPSIVCGTSVGAINAAKLTEGEDPGNPKQGLAGLESLWADMKVNADMYADEPWLTHPDMDPRLADYLRGKSSALPINAPTHEGPWGYLQVAVNFANDVGFLITDGQSLLKSLGVITTQARGVYNLGPIGQKIASYFDPGKLANWAAGGGKLRLAVVSLDSGRLRYVTETGHLIERDGSPVTDPDSVAAPCQPVANQLADLEREVGALQIELRAVQAELHHAAPGEKPLLVGEIRKLREQIAAKSADVARRRAEVEACTRANPSPFRLRDIRDGILASASIPGIFLPVRIGREYYVDGGIRDVIPMQAAVDLGASDVYAIHASSRTVLPFVTPSTGGIISITARSLVDLTIDEIDLSDRNVIPSAAVEEAPRILHIEPEVDLHDITVIDPGLIRICHDYGYMRAADALDRVRNDARRAQLATGIALHRREIWRVENRFAGQPDPTQPYLSSSPADPSFQGTIDQQKGELRNLIAERRQLGGPMPNDIEVWTSRFELHPWLNDLGNDARFVRQTVPPSMRQGEHAHVTITMLNSGTASWDPARNYRLGSQTPQDNTVWGTNRIALRHAVPPGTEVTFAFDIPAPTPPGALFHWQMVQDGVGWFGATNSGVRIVSSANPGPECAALRRDIHDLDEQILLLEDALTGDPRADAPIRRRMLDLKNKRSTVVARAQALDCPP